PMPPDTAHELITSVDRYDPTFYVRTAAPASDQHRLYVRLQCAQNWICGYHLFPHFQGQTRFRGACWARIKSKSPPASGIVQEKSNSDRNLQAVPLRISHCKFLDSHMTACHRTESSLRGAGMHKKQVARAARAEQPPVF